MAVQIKKNQSTNRLVTSRSLSEAVELAKSSGRVKFDGSLDLAVRLGVDPQKTDQMIRGSASLPYGTGRPCKVLALCTADKQQEAEQAGADYVGFDDYIKKIEQGWRDIHLIVTMPTIMAKLGKLGKILGPRGLMPNPKIGTVTMDVAKVVREVKNGKIFFKTDKYGIVHASVGRASFASEKVEANIMELLRTIVRLKSVSLKGVYVHSISLSSTMGKGFFIDKNVAMGL